jgi:hypothetical protein
MAKLKQDTLLCYKCELHMYIDQIKTGHFAMLQMCVTYVKWPNENRTLCYATNVSYICTMTKLKQDTLLCYKCVLHMYNDQIKTGHFAMLQMYVT